MKTYLTDEKKNKSLLSNQNNSEHFCNVTEMKKDVPQRSVLGP